MKKIKIYGSKQNPIIGIVMFIAFMAGCMFSMYQSGGKTNSGIMIPAMMFALSAAISIVAFAIRKPKLIISDYSDCCLRHQEAQTHYLRLLCDDKHICTMGSLFRRGRLILSNQLQRRRDDMHPLQERR